MSNNIFLESLSVGLTTAFVGLFISTISMFVFSKNFTLKKYKFWPSVFFNYFITGFIIHLIYEWTGMNKKFCCDRNYSCK